jgi:uncharacterized protein DUF2846
MYFLREKGVLGALGGSAPTAELNLDGKPVDAVTNGGYIFVDRPPGTYRLSVQSGISLAFETDVQVSAGRDYYFNIGVPRTGAIGSDFLNQVYAGRQGRADAGAIPARGWIGGGGVLHARPLDRRRRGSAAEGALRGLPPDVGKADWRPAGRQLPVAAVRPCEAVRPPTHARAGALLTILRPTQLPAIAFGRCSLRLAVRTSPSHGENRSSILLGSAMISKT